MSWATICSMVIAVLFLGLFVGGLNATNPPPIVVYAGALGAMFFSGIGFVCSAIDRAARKKSN